MLHHTVWRTNSRFTERGRCFKMCGNSENSAFRSYIFLPTQTRRLADTNENSQYFTSALATCVARRIYLCLPDAVKPLILISHWALQSKGVHDSIVVIQRDQQERACGTGTQRGHLTNSLWFSAVWSLWLCSNLVPEHDYRWTLMWTQRFFKGPPQNTDTDSTRSRPCTRPLKWVFISWVRSVWTQHHSVPVTRH